MYNPVKLKVQWVKIVPSSSIDTETGVVLVFVLVYSTYFFLDILGFFSSNSSFYKGTRNPFQTRSEYILRRHGHGTGELPLYFSIALL